ncbi:MAG: DMT family transporter [Acidimicrobiales bacterium]
MTPTIGADPPSRRSGAVYGLLAAALFGASTPAAKQLLGNVEPQLLAGLLYAGAALVLTATRPLHGRRDEAPIRRSDLPTLVAVVVMGGIVAPVALLAGLDRISALSGSLLLNLEAPLTILLAVVFFGEHLDRRAVLGGAVVMVASLALSGGDSGAGTMLGSVLVAVACACWAVDNNLTQRLSDRDPFRIVQVKTGVAGAVNVAIALALGQRWPSLATLLVVVAVGGAAYGASVVLDAYALRHLGAAREAALFATAPFFGALLAVTAFGEPIDPREVAVGLAMAGGVSLLLTEHHLHTHDHAAVSHEHRHRHDDGHHGHPHDPPVLGWHSHPHEHVPQRHVHRHVTDSHHRHRHGTGS